MGGPKGFLKTERLSKAKGHGVGGGIPPEQWLKKGCGAELLEFIHTYGNLRTPPCINEKHNKCVGVA